MDQFSSTDSVCYDLGSGYDSVSSFRRGNRLDEAHETFEATSPITDTDGSSQETGDIALSDDDDAFSATSTDETYTVRRKSKQI